jgi:ketopantoate reductase
MRERGVTVLSPRGDFHAHPHATDDPASIGPVDIVFLGLKAYSYRDAGPLLAPLLRPGTGVPDLRSDIWLKLLGNVAFNPVSVLTRATMGSIAEHPGTRKLVLSMMHETALIAERLGSPPKISVERRFEGAAKVGDHKTSMLMDFEAGKPLETDVLLAAPVELARLVGVPVPALEMVHALIDLLIADAG